MVERQSLAGSRRLRDLRYSVWQAEVTNGYHVISDTAEGDVALYESDGG